LTIAAILALTLRRALTSKFKDPCHFSARTVIGTSLGHAPIRQAEP
jgi:hypothetical protein